MQALCVGDAQENLRPTHTKQYMLRRWDVGDTDGILVRAWASGTQPGLLGRARV